ncbi:MULTISPECIES: carbohydrate ABC transporter permease [Carnobacterium]|jgi:multiple sugar transport system permease protein|uniref:Putative transport system permease n=1 Tax=Carnobacterium maltaromaticum TaxID=2751 RepID=A0A1Z5AWW2_CARML|nr:sugar ABC transporter permease [Carnobacterium maltaromaticum]KRN87186.1 sugar ABC transporter permease [Carnobacterium maltaromaticum]MCI1820491.1 sugar ABC transporter permease [Carnobacterium maltaromaticum]TFJ69122.1 sugar ABC transporter permease [Carnobacterium maltaromaticum]TFJ75663.1 sugar ABC transporter permease [Carnobacterium maltaromaticum]CRI06562.1 putative transport system permease [Carnobacterium maltaromaticum]
MNEKKKKKFTSIENPFSGYLFIAPQVILMAVFIIYPVFNGFKMSFYEVYGMDSYFVGFDNFINLFSDPIFMKSVVNTIFFVAAIVILTIVFALFVATTVYDKNSKYVSFIRGSYYLPVMVSMVVMSIIWNFLLNPSNGLISYMLGNMGVKDVNLLGNPNTVMSVIIFVTFIGNVGQAIILYLATMIGLPEDYFEAAQLDGATRWQRIRHILIPLMKPTTAYLTVINIIAVLKIFVVIQLLTGGGPNNGSVTMMYYLYQNAFVYNNTGVASAIGVLMFIIALLLSMPQLKSFLKTK